MVVQITRKSKRCSPLFWLLPAWWQYGPHLLPQLHQASAATANSFVMSVNTFGVSVMQLMIKWFYLMKYVSSGKVTVLAQFEIPGYFAPGPAHLHRGVSNENLTRLEIIHNYSIYFHRVRSSRRVLTIIWLYYNSAAGSLHTRKLCSRLYSIENELYLKMQKLLIDPAVGSSGPFVRLLIWM